MNLTPTQADQDTAYYRDILHTLIDQGAALAARIHATAMAATTPDSAVADATIAFDRVARAVRRTIALARHIVVIPAAQPNSATRATNRTMARAQLIRGVEDAIHRKRCDTDVETLYAEFAERLEDPALEFDLAGCAIDDVIKEICRDLGVAQQGRSFVWKRRTPTDIASLRERAAATTATAPSPDLVATLQLLQGGKPGHPRSDTPETGAEVPYATGIDAPIAPTPPPQHEPAPPRP